MAAPTVASSFHVMCTGQIQSITYDGVENLYCKYGLTYGSDWHLEHGVESGLSQIGYRAAARREIAFHFPLDMTFKTTNPFGWPRLVLSVYGMDMLGRDVIRGYGSVLLPTVAGTHTKRIPLFKPQSSSMLQGFIAWLTASPPEFFDAKFIAQSDGRELTRVTSQGFATVEVNVTLHGFQQHGYVFTA
ncbi:hypothetical protein SDRG_10189 [Saprolegnia diclina VS20]|uniref:B9 domain-containing protein 1 n=1 Tax=Saprolegnia diclina (strain VS20) TaxID=1156394 RepID=T0Q2E7_SAPDV|nr:hypothetical protein SDRG_10189 [Saprolegnia diclina VS20]EQC31989.1 hypothetical protein SDRG_10189 [Saprolegnia diclina VS20]|eukprot:XP_008614391.1 hypothetical protein SDRG_10189 [Saprolegnia diclina VS20]